MMNPVKQWIDRSRSGEDRGRRRGGRRGVLAPVFAALAMAALLLNLGLTQFTALGYLAQDGFAVPQDTLTRLLRDGGEPGEVALLPVGLGEAVYTRALGAQSYYVGEEKQNISGGYPLYTQSGAVLYFLDDSLNMVTDQWEVLSSYEGLYLSDGVTFNADRTQADIARVRLVQVEGGYQVAQPAQLTGGGRSSALPMNAVCVFSESEVLCYAYSGGTLAGSRFPVAAGAKITIGSDSFEYLDFLEKLGLWAEKAEIVPQPEVTPTPEPTQSEEPKEEATAPAGGSAPAQPGQTQEGQTAETVPPTHTPAVRPERPTPEPADQETGEHETIPAPDQTPQAPSEVLEKPGAAQSNPDSNPESPSSPDTPVDPNPSYQEPKVSFSTPLEPWVYTLTTQATVSDPSNALDGGVQIYVYKVNESGGESQVLRRVVTASGQVSLGQLEPGYTYHVTAQYKYSDKLNYPKTVTLDLGTAQTEPFDSLTPISLSFYDEKTAPLGAAVDIYAKSLQLRDLVLPSVSNGTVTTVGGITTHPATDPLKAETYISSFALRAKNPSGTAIKLDMPVAALRLLREGYTLEHWETPEKLQSGTDYTYALTMEDLVLQDRYGNTFQVQVAGAGEGVPGGGHTCKESPEVTILVPSATNLAGNTLIRVTAKNPDNAVISANPSGGAMGENIAAALFLVEKGQEVTPANAVELMGYQGDASDTTTGKFLPVDFTPNGAVTEWTVTNLPIMKNYTAGVLCGYYNVEDGRSWEDKTLDKTTDFLTASLSNLGTISYTAEVDQLTHQSGRLKFRMNSADERLLPLLDQVTFTLQLKNGGEEQAFTLYKEELEKCVFTPPTTADSDGGFTAAVSVPVHMAGDETAYTAQLTLMWKNLPQIDEETPTETVWDFLLATSASATADQCWLALTLGGALEATKETPAATLTALAPKTSYVGRFATQAKQGGVLQDVTSGSSKTVRFTTLSEEALASFDNAFVSTDFIELYGLAFTDPDSCIMPDAADRGGSNVLIRILTANGVQTASRYVDSAQSYDSLRISGLALGQTYTMVVTALKYSDGGTGQVEVNRNLKLQYNEEGNVTESYAYTFTTGESVVGDLSLVSVSQLYEQDDGSASDALGLLTEEDFYQGVWQDGARLYYTSDSALETYKLKAAQREPAEVADQAIDPDSVTSNYTILPITSYTADETVQETLENSWTTRFIAVEPGEQYAIYNTAATAYFRIDFFYAEPDSTVLKYYGCWSSGYYLEGGVFSVPSTKLGGTGYADKIRYMRISGYDQRVSSAMVLEKYIKTQASDIPKLDTSKLRVVEGMRLNSGNGLSFDANYAHVSDYIPVTGGSVYELKGRDPNKPDADAFLNGNLSDSEVLFYGSDYTFLGSYTVCNQTALVKAPFGAAYCRLNLLMKQNTDGTITLDRSAFSFKLYKQAVQGQYLATLQVKLTDASARSLLEDGKYGVTLYVSTGSVSDSDDLTAQSYAKMGEERVYTVTADDLKTGALDITQTLSFEDLPSKMGFKAVLNIYPADWNGSRVTLDTVYFTTNRVVRTVSNLAGLLAMRDDPAGSYVVTKDILDVTGQILGSNRPFTGTIDFQGHTVRTTSFLPLFYRISGSGVVKNLVLEYNAAAEGATAVKSGIGALCTINYGAIQNIIVHYKPDNQGFGLDVQYAGGITRYNYGLIDGFVVQFEKDIRVANYFGGVVYENYGVVANGYVCGADVVDSATGQTRSAQVVHVWRDENGTQVSTDTTYVALCVGYNSARGTVRNVFTVGDLIVQSADASDDRANADYLGSGANKNDHYETSTTGTSSAGLLVGSQQGVVRNAFTTGDRRDYDPVKNQWSYMLDRGPAVATVSSRYETENLTYFSNTTAPYSQYTSAESTIASYNVRGEMDSLYDYQWYDSVLGADGDRFSIRDKVDEGYYPSLVLPDCFDADAQPQIPLPSLSLARVEVLSNEVRLQGVKEALVTVTLDFPPSANKATISGFTVVDRNSVAIDCEVLAQRAVEDGYRVDALLSLPDSGAALPDSRYTITGVAWTGGSQTFQGQAGEREIQASFWRELGSLEEWKARFSSSTAGIYGNYLLTADLDFGDSSTYKDWYCSKGFYGALDGGDYTTVQKALTTDAGAALTNKDGTARTILVREGLTGMHTISGVGNLDRSGKTYVSGRDVTGQGSLFTNLYGTLKNLVFEDFKTGGAVTCSAMNSGYAGVVGVAQPGGLLENCHVRDSVFYGRVYVGALVGYGTGATLRSCSVAGTTVNTSRPNSNSTDTVGVGALAGYVNGGLVENSFAANVSVKATDVYDAYGVGGLIGWSYSTTVQSCYTTGLVDAGSGRVGGVVGQMGGTGSLTGCWSTATVMTVADYAGGVVGYHATGQLSNNYTASTIITRSLAAGSVHRICSTTTYDENQRRDNYAFQGQYITYFDADAANGESLYQFGVWEEEDGATGLLERTELVQSAVWSGIIGVGGSFDLEGSALSGGASGGTVARSVAAGYMPKLVGDSGQLLYDQPDVGIGYVSTSALGRVKVDVNTTDETFYVELALFSDREDILTASAEQLADWSALAITGATVLGDVTVSEKPYDNDELDSRSGRVFTFTASYGGTDGHYLDSYILTLPVYDGKGEDGKGNAEVLQARISFAEPVYKIIYDIHEWDKFFSNPRYASAYENVQIGWANSDGGVIDFSAKGDHQLNVKVNRLNGEKQNGKMPTLKNLDVTFTTAGKSLIAQAVTEVSNLHFENLKLSSTVKVGEKETQYGGNGKGVIGLQQGNMKNVTFTDITVDGGSSHYVGVIGQLYGEVDKVELKNITVITQNSVVGGLVGWATTSSTVNKVTIFAAEGKRNTITSRANNQVGGLIGRLDGIGSNLSVTDTDVAGLAFVGGAVGYSQSNGERPEEQKLTNVMVGDSAKATSTPGASAKPSVTVAMKLADGVTSSSDMSYLGGAVGHGGSQPMSDINVYDAKVSIDSKADNDKLDDGNYAYYVGGVTGAGGDNQRNSLAKNCTVISYGGYAGGVSGSSIYWNNTAQDCVVMGISDQSTCVGGIVGVGRADRSLAQHCVVSGGSCVGGVSGKATSLHRQNGAVDCVVVGKESVGGLSGWFQYYDAYGCYVTGSEGVSTTVTETMLSPARADAATATAYTGSAVVGDSYVGGLMGTFVGVTIHDSYVDSGVTVQGSKSVGGLVGRYYGGYADYYATTARYLYACAMGAAVTGTAEDSTGGLIGEYTKSGSSTLPTANGPIPANFYGLLVTGTVNGNANLLMPGAKTDASQFNSVRVYDPESKLGLTSYDAAKILAASDLAVYMQVLSVTAENLADANLYFLSRVTVNTSGTVSGMGGMSWSRNYWSDDTVQAMYQKVTAPASKGTYGDGINKDSLVLWLDARNNTGAGYTDEAATTWTDLSNQHNDAVLYWNNKSASAEENASFSISERSEFMRWNNGALEFMYGSPAFYAQLEQSLSPYLQNAGYTVELIYTYMTPAYSGHSGILSWVDGAFRGGFHGAYNMVYPYAILHRSVNSAGTGADYTAVNVGEKPAASLYRSAAFVTGEASGKQTLQYYLNGALQGTNSNAIVALQNTDTTQWRIGQGNYTNAYLQVCGVRVYGRTLTAEEIKKNAEYDQWYYFGGTKPERAAATDSTPILEENGTVSGGTGPYKLLRSEDGSYNGTLVDSAYQEDGLGSRGYYYVMDSNGLYSNVVALTAPGYGPRLRSTSLNNEYYGSLTYTMVRGQEGERSVTGEDGIATLTLNDGEDGLFLGGYRLPDAGLTSRDGTAMVAAPFSLLDAGGLPEVKAYASGADRVNLELLENPPEGLTYQVRSGDTVVLEGAWPADSRTLTMTWNYTDAFTLRLALGEETEEWTWGYADLARTVMTYGKGYWYLYGSECYDQTGTSLDQSKVFLHMMDGFLLDEDGKLWAAEDFSSAGSVTSFQLTDTTPLWAGTAQGVSVESFATYLLCDGGLKDGQLVMKGEQPYTMPGNGAVPGSFVVDAYGESVYTTYLGTDGRLCDSGVPLAYPQDFAGSGIRELSNTLHDSGHIVLVRYQSGKLAAFNYLTGEPEEVLSQEDQDISVLDFALSQIQSLRSTSLLSGGAGQALKAVEYQKEVEGDPSLQTALANLKSNETGNSATDGAGSGLNEAGLPGGLDGAGSAGVDGDNGLDAVVNEGQGVTTGEALQIEGPGLDGAGALTTETGKADPSGGASPAPESTDAAVDGEGLTVSGTETALDGTGAMEEGTIATEDGPGDTASGTSDGENPGAEAGESTHSGGDAAAAGDSGAESQPTAAQEQETSKPDPATGGEREVSAHPEAGTRTTRYVAVYDAANGENAVYDLEEYLTQPTEDLVSQEERAEQLEKLGFQTTLLARNTQSAATVSGLTLLILTSAVALVLLVCMGELKRRKLDRRNEETGED